MEKKSILMHQEGLSRTSDDSFRPIDAGTLVKSYCSSFQPSAFAKENLFYMTLCGHYFCTDKYGISRESYPENLILFVRKGQMDVLYQKEAYQMRSGDILLINCRYPHAYYGHDGLEFVYLHFEGGNSQILTDYLLEMNGGPIFSYDCNLAIGIEMYETVTKNKSGRLQNLMENHFWLHSLLHRLSAAITPPVENGTPVDIAISYILDHVGEDISLDLLAEKTSFNKYYLSHIFKKQTGYSIAEYILSTRIQKAEQLLLHSNRSIEDIAYEVGYSHASSFINIFKNRVGFSPKQYRKSKLGG